MNPNKEQGLSEEAVIPIQCTRCKKHEKLTWKQIKAWKGKFLCKKCRGQTVLNVI